MSSNPYETTGLLDESDTEYYFEDGEDSGVREEEEPVSRVVPGRAVRSRLSLLGGSHPQYLSSQNIHSRASRGQTQPNGEAQMRQPKTRNAWKWPACVASSTAFGLALATILLVVYFLCYQPCSMVLQEVRVNRLPDKRRYISETIAFNLSLLVANPNRVSASVSHAYLRLSISDPSLAVRYDVHEPIRYPVNATAAVPASTTLAVSLPVSVKVATLSEGLRVVMLLHQGCFAIGVQGEITYTVGGLSRHTAHINHSQSLFEASSCPACG